MVCKFNLRKPLGMVGELKEQIPLALPWAGT
jgi:hypothetical protein